MLIEKNVAFGHLKETARSILVIALIILLCFYPDGTSVLSAALI